jgi:hypothetical protein
VHAERHRRPRQQDRGGLHPSEVEQLALPDHVVGGHAAELLLVGLQHQAEEVVAAPVLMAFSLAAMIPFRMPSTSVATRFILRLALVGSNLIEQNALLRSNQFSAVINNKYIKMGV